MAMLFNSNVSSPSGISQNTRYLSQDLSVNLAQNELSKSLLAINSSIENLSNNVCCVQFNNSGISVNVPDGKIVLNSVLRDYYSLYSIDKGTFTAPKDTLLNFTVSMVAGNLSVGSPLSLYILKNSNFNTPDLTNQLSDPLISSLIYYNSSSTPTCFISANWYVLCKKGDVFIFYKTGSSFNVQYNNAQITMKW